MQAIHSASRSIVVAAVDLAAAGLGAVLGALALWWTSAAPLAAARAGVADFDMLVGLTAALAAGTVLGWVVLVVAATALSAVPGAAGVLAGRVADRVTPLALQEVVRVALGVSVVMAPVTAALPSAWASESPQPQAEVSRRVPSIGRPALDAPDRPPVARAPRAQHEVITPEQRRELCVVVRRGDTLWEIAARHLGPGVTDLEVAAEWPRWWRANRLVIGSDPHLILPGMRLRPPHPGRV